ncbi:hypothetical protein Kpol_1002p5 [Vanderwaltozyma polyspora DSM 70294]|uniref:Glucose transport transcription regulator RGT1 n=1 Tax=Vanderwaltozyma polyspora (strain ATCC 22028 / DSM 70294 / BCRC 21397 / CBS 2163 / NBRC 10782 / NRRL Y-8283 / UCD 57-17) TaxID=436907 RepID=RGT1_VANPO|nr:uncharacterized protein Kpol_1002p5 [Vanderwaltozyma polyspora DSM 70294]A7TE38.1 RecName: Full=Glucose transport transcription regulator RGT1; AltName: Full=Restores glucose transport protein 1 [Vanderwaltozyma polyspora DSM 70294]EDO19360.1 hypothetical protein Kpol_1002p5 [Vanderwaltozyma polyspora DSM 70294]
MTDIAESTAHPRDGVPPSQQTTASVASAALATATASASPTTGSATSTAAPGKRSRSSSTGSAKGSIGGKKATRACDQCRKRKIKCDYDNDKNVCSSCNRNGDRCQFNRVQLKRGPSKGFNRNNSTSSAAGASTTSSTHQTFNANASGNTNSSNNNNHNNNNNNSVLLPPITQYFQGNEQNHDQQFWKVPVDLAGHLSPHHSQSHLHRDSVDSATSNNSNLNINGINIVDNSTTNSQSGGYFPVSACRSRASSVPSFPRKPPMQIQPPMTSMYASSLGGGTPATGAIGASNTAVSGATVPGTSSKRRKSVVSSNESPRTSRASLLPRPDFAVVNLVPVPQNVVTPASSLPAVPSGPLPSTGVGVGGSTGQVRLTDLDLINTYYEFVHLNFPVIPINKKALTSDILVINTSIEELNDLVIVWFRNSLELLVTVSLEQPQTQSTHAYTESLNSCFQNVVNLYPRLKQNNGIDPKVKIVYLCTFLILIYVLFFLGQHNSFIISVSVTIFNNFGLYGKLLSLNTSSPDSSSPYDIIFVRLYLLLVTFDSSYSMALGTPKLLNLEINGLVDKFFNLKSQNEHLFIDENLIKVNCILKNLELGEYICNASHMKDSSDAMKVIKSTYMSKKHQSKKADHSSSVSPMFISEWFQKFLVDKKNLISLLLDYQLRINDITPLQLSKLYVDLTNSLCALITVILEILKLMMKLNPTNSIDYNYRPLQHFDIDKPPSGGGGSSSTNTSSNPYSNPNSNEFYQKLLGLSSDRNTNLADMTRGCITPFAIITINELFNVTELIKNIPSSLISVVMESTKEEKENTINPQDLVLKLSNSMNEIVQITSLLTMVKPYKGIDSSYPRWQKFSKRSGPIPSMAPSNTATSTIQDFSEYNMTRSPSLGSSAYSNNPHSQHSDHNFNETNDYNDNISIFKKIYYENNNIQNNTTPQNEVLQSYIDTAWRLLDDSELGWL